MKRPTLGSKHQSNDSGNHRTSHDQADKDDDVVVPHKKSSTRMIEKFMGSFSFELSQEFSLVSSTNSTKEDEPDLGKEGHQSKQQKQKQKLQQQRLQQKQRQEQQRNKPMARQEQAREPRQRQRQAQQQPQQHQVNIPGRPKFIPSIEEYMSSDDNSTHKGPRSEELSVDSMRSFSESSALGNSSYDSSSFNNSSGGGGGNVAAASPVLELVKEETRVVRTAKAILVMGIVLAAAAVGTVTFLLVRREEVKRFEREFEDFAIEMSEVSKGVATRTFAMIQTLSQYITAAGLATIVDDGDNNNSIMGFPFVTMPYFHVQGHQILTIGGADVVLYAPMVSMKQKENWESYATNNQQQWMSEGWKYQQQRRRKSQPQEEEEGERTTTHNPGSIPTEIYPFGGKGSPGHLHEFGDIHFPGYYLPVWQMYGVPTNASVINLDLLTTPTTNNSATSSINGRGGGSEFEHAIVDIHQRRKGIISNIGDYSYLTKYSMTLSNAKSTSSSDTRTSNDENGGGPPSPQSFIIEPVFADLENTGTDGTGTNSEIVGFVIAVVTWKEYLRRFLLEATDANGDVTLSSSASSGGNDMHVVLEDGCGKVHTYEVSHNRDGTTNVDYLGNSDLHQSQYNEFQHAIDFAPFSRLSVDDGGNHPTSYIYGPSESLNEFNEPCHGSYVLNLYPTSKLEDLYDTNQDVIFSWSIVAVFVLILILLASYVRLVGRRQRKLMEKAQKTNAIVASLFPERIQQRMMEEVEVDEELYVEKGESTLIDFGIMDSAGIAVETAGAAAYEAASAVTGAVTARLRSGLDFSIHKQTNTEDNANTENATTADTTQDNINNGRSSMMAGSRMGLGHKQQSFRFGFKSSHDSPIAEDDNDNGRNVVNANDGRPSMRSSPRPGLGQKQSSIRFGRKSSHDELYAFDSKPIADLFTDCTIFFADLAGFTAWSSTREPTQVFALLETIYHAFDEIARSRGIFKVETVGDCYVAAAGLPEPRDDHAIAMAKFARDCLHKFHRLVRQMEVVLGPDTGELGLRAGLHSGPVTAGVLRGEKSRFQLFGDTVNTASRMESTGMKDRIQISQDTADKLLATEMRKLVRKREDIVTAKGKGKMQTYWLLSKWDLSSSDVGSSHRRDENVRSSMKSLSYEDEETPAKSGDDAVIEDKEARLIGWNVEILSRLLKQIVAMRDDDEGVGDDDSDEFANDRDDDSSSTNLRVDTKRPLDEVQEIIALPPMAAKYSRDPEKVELSWDVKKQLRDYVTNISLMYRDNPFHSFEHASHVTMSTVKLLTRIVAPTTIDYDDMCYKDKENSKLHDHTYGITSDPLTQFACVLSALIHDVDHMGVPNAQLVKSDCELARMYGNKSVAEQNSVDLAWDLLMEPAYDSLRKCIYKTKAELGRFRQLVVNSVMATDIVDKELGALRRQRWEKAFAKTSSSNNATIDDSEQSSRDDINRKATIVIEHLIQASDVAHTMQHWHVYLKWNERLFHEVYKAYKEGRGSDTDPSEGWYKGELGFFDFYIVPLAKKLKECGVFGVSSDEYLNYALANRKEWEQKGREIVEGYVREFHAKKTP